MPEGAGAGAARNGGGEPPEHWAIIGALPVRRTSKVASTLQGPSGKCKEPKSGVATDRRPRASRAIHVKPFTHSADGSKAVTPQECKEKAMNKARAE